MLGKPDNFASSPCFVIAFIFKSNDAIVGLFTKILSALKDLLPAKLFNESSSITSSEDLFSNRLKRTCKGFIFSFSRSNSLFTSSIRTSIRRTSTIVPLPLAN